MRVGLGHRVPVDGNHSAGFAFPVVEGRPDFLRVDKDHGQHAAEFAQDCSPGSFAVAGAVGALFADCGAAAGNACRREH